MAELNKVKGIVVGQYGEVIVLQVVDKNASPVDISAYTTSITIKARDPYALNVLTFTGSFNTTGTDGKIKFTPTSNNTFDRDGDWDAQITLKSASVSTLTVLFTIEVGESLG